MEKEGGETPQARGGSSPSPLESKHLQRKGTVSFPSLHYKEGSITTEYISEKELASP